MKNEKKLRQRAQQLRTNSTDAENELWYFLRNRQLKGYKFKRQVLIGPYIVDFLCHHKKLIIELDGGQHTECVKYDEERTQFLQQKGYSVIRFWNHEVIQSKENVLNVILDLLEYSHPLPHSTETSCPLSHTTLKHLVLSLTQR